MMQMLIAPLPVRHYCYANELLSVLFSVIHQNRRQDGRPKSHQSSLKSQDPGRNLPPQCESMEVISPQVGSLW